MERSWQDCFTDLWDCGMTSKENPKSIHLNPKLNMDLLWIYSWYNTGLGGGYYFGTKQRHDGNDRGSAFGGHSSKKKYLKAPKIVCQHGISRKDPALAWKKMHFKLS